MGNAESYFLPVAYMGVHGLKSMHEKRPRETLARPVKSSGAGGRTRTGTWFPTADFESAASANSATPADDICRQRSPL